jgi:hypothetical protein
VTLFLNVTHVSPDDDSENYQTLNGYIVRQVPNTDHSILISAFLPGSRSEQEERG